MKRFCTICLLAAAIFFSPLFCFSDNSSATLTIKNLDSQIESLSTELQTLRKEALNKEIHAQTYMIDDWHQFAEEVEASEESEKAILKIKKKIQELKKQRELLEKHTQ